MTPCCPPRPGRYLPHVALLTAAVTWGVIWYPYRLLEAAGLSGGVATLATYALALLMVLPLASGRLAPPPGRLGGLLVVALVSGWTNLAYVLAVIDGEVMRVMLLFYLAPLWTVLFARLILGERPHPHGYLVVALSLAGGVVMLHDGSGSPPLPNGRAEWLGLSAGVGFALANVVSRRIRDVPLATRSVWVFAGVAAVALVPAFAPGAVLPAPSALMPMAWLLLAVTAGGIVLATLTVQYGLAHTAANQAIVVLLVELVAAALFSWLLAGEVMEPREWLGGAMIVAASLLSGRMVHS